VTQVASPPVPRPPKKPRKGELHRVHVLMPAEMLEAVDRLAAERGADDGAPWMLKASRTRTDAIRLLLYEGLKKRGLLK
jgi:hypothetical protein